MFLAILLLFGFQDSPCHESLSRGDLKSLAVVDFDTSTLTTNVDLHANRQAKSIRDKEVLQMELKKMEKEAKDEMNYLSQALMAALERQLQASYQLVERRKLATVLREQEIAEPKIIGQIFGAEFLLTGTVTEFAIEKKQIDNHAYLKGKTSPMVFTRYQMSASFRLIDTCDGSLVLVEEATAVTDSASLRDKGRVGIAYRQELCQDLAQQIEQAMETGLLAMD